MSLLNVASLITTPNAYKAGKLYSIVPTSGNGDMTVVRATTATRVNSSGLIESVGVNVPRLDYPAVGGCPSILLEPQRTNSTANSTMVGASVSPSTFPTGWTVNSSGLTQTVVGVGTENGLPYIDVRFNGVAIATGSGIRTSGTTAVAATQNQVWTSSAYLKIVAEPLPATNYRLNNIERNSIGTFLTSYNTMFTNTTLQRIGRTFTVLDAATVFIQVEILAAGVIGQSYDFTIRIASPQLELGAYPTSFIPTTTTALTRNGDLLFRNNIYTNNLITASGGTWFLDTKNFENGASAVGSGSNEYSMNVGGFTVNSFIIGLNSSGLRFIKKTNSTNVIDYSIPNSATLKTKIAISWDVNLGILKIFFNGLLMNTYTSQTFSNYEILSLHDALSLNTITTHQINGCMLFPTPLTDAECTSLTTL